MQWNVLTIEDYKRCLLNACIDSHLYDSHIVRPVFLVFFKQIYSKHLTNGEVYAFYLLEVGELMMQWYAIQEVSVERRHSGLC